MNCHVTQEMYNTYQLPPFHKKRQNTFGLAKYCQEIGFLIYTVRLSQFCRKLWVYTFQLVIFFCSLQYLHLHSYWLDGTRISHVYSTHHTTLKSYFNQNNVYVHICAHTQKNGKPPNKQEENSTFARLTSCSVKRWLLPPYVFPNLLCP